jgi:hypothetical protein
VQACSDAEAREGGRGFQQEAKDAFYQDVFDGRPLFFFLLEKGRVTLGLTFCWVYPHFFLTLTRGKHATLVRPIEHGTASVQAC